MPVKVQHTELSTDPYRAPGTVTVEEDETAAVLVRKGLAIYVPTPKAQDAPTFHRAVKVAPVKRSVASE